MRRKLFIMVVCISLFGCRAYAIADTAGILSKIDTFIIKGYYVVNRLKSEIGSAAKITKNSAGGMHLQLRMDVHVAERFIPDDSLKCKSLSSYLQDFYANTTQVYTNCLDNERLLSNVTHVNQYDRCKFKLPIENNLYELSYLNSEDVFEIYYIKAIAVKFKLKNNFTQRDMVRSKIAERCIEPSVKEFDVICLTELKEYNSNAIINLKDISLWKQ